MNLEPEQRKFENGIFCSFPITYYPSALALRRYTRYMPRDGDFRGGAPFGLLLYKCTIVKHETLALGLSV